MSDDKAPSGSGSAVKGAGSLPPSPWRRLLWWILPIGYWVVASRVPLPGVDPGAFSGQLFWVEGLGMSLLTAGLAPLVVGYVVAEIGAVAVPAWRPLRQTQRGRGALGRAAFLAAIVVALLSAWKTLSVVRNADALVGSGFLLVATLLGATALLWIVVHACDRRSSGSALGVLIGLSSAVLLLRGGIVEPWFTARPKELPQPVTAVVLTLLALVATGVVLRARTRGAPGDARLSIRIPMSGLVPLWGVEILSGAVVASVVTGVRWRALEEISSPWVGALVGLVVVVSIEVLVSWPATAAVWGALFEGEEAAPEGAGRLPLDEVGAAYAPPREPTAGEGPVIGGERARVWAARTRGLLVRGSVPMMAYLALVAWPAWPVLDRPDVSGRIVAAMAGACLLVAAIADVVAEMRFRLAHRDAVSVAVQPHVGAADAVTAALAEVSVPAFARNVNVRVLLSFFGAFAPIEVLVPGSRVAAARGRLLAILPEEPESEGPPGGESEPAGGGSGAAPKRRVIKKRRKRPAAEETS